MTNRIPYRHLLALYVLIAVLGAWMVLATNTEVTTQESGDWACLQTVCSQSEPGGELWAQENCGTIEDENGTLIEACSVVINGQEQIIQRNAINFSAIRSCTEYTCVQEIRVREVNYTVNQEVIAGQ